MAIDKELYRKAYESLRQWSEIEKVERAREAGRLSPEEAWRRYVDLFEFGWQIGIRQSQRQHEQKMADIARYYERVQRFEAWRRACKSILDLPFAPRLVFSKSTATITPSLEASRCHNGVYHAIRTISISMSSFPMLTTNL